MNKQYFVDKALNAIQFLEEMGGPDGQDYIDVMKELRDEMTIRMRAAEAVRQVAIDVKVEMGYN